MDSFDDLLAPSRNLLEENPFADPFTNRSSSPDPWASPFAVNQSDSAPYDDIATAPSHSSYKIQEYDASATIGSSSSAVPVSNDPLDSESLALSTEDSAPGHGFSHTPGFKESVEPGVPESSAIQPARSENIESVTTSESEQSPSDTTTPASVTATYSSQSYQSPPPPSHVLPLSLNAADPNFVSPLESPGPVRFERSIANLSLGGESFGGWMSEQTPMSSEGKSPVVTLSQEDVDSDDDKPIRQTMKSQMRDGDQSKHGEESSSDTQIQPVFVIKVDDPQKVGDPIRPYIMYTVHTRTTSPLFKKSTFSVLRRYSDFLWLYEVMSNNNPGVIVPPVPEKSSFNRFDEQFVRQRRLALEKCIQKIANHPVLCKDPDLKLFLESDTFSLDIKHRKAELAHERGGLMASIGQTIAGPRFHETDEWFDRQKTYLDGLESQLRGLVKAVELVARQRAELAIVAGEFSHAVSDLAAADVGRELSSSLGGLADVERKYQELQTTQAEQDIITLMSTAEEYTRLISSVRNAFNSRIRVYHSWKHSESDLHRIKQTHEKNKIQGRLQSDRLAYSLSQVAEAERRAVAARQEYEHVSRLVKSEMRRFEKERIDDFQVALHNFLEGTITRQKELISGWEGYQQTILKRDGSGDSAQEASGSS
ncbi:hypothetical protein AMATHDRAFT_58242 [Amanita thiersii Skay4041]|uniref:PX domain-containing protein n=1 Tax=Amanita thiersii Skay4041 TaxID=703135 RepID=A0A2A9NVH0_9AGAR|nr:hypothetical protein AMATHDRAFT_58242 [Amanita thiersii Skay4041]